MLKPYKKPDGPRAGYFGRCGKMIIKPYSIPKKLRNKFLVKFFSFLPYNIEEHECWLWEGRIHNGYAVCPTPGGDSKWGHRVSYALFNGDIKKGMHIDHTCRNRTCVNPRHLRQVTPQENYEAIRRRRLRDEKKIKEENGQLTLWQDND